MTRTNKTMSESGLSLGAPVQSGEQPARIGPYRILRVLGQGGMGMVYLAEQTEGVRREVALKVLKTDVSSDAVLARFETERQALAVMEHPGITKVFDAGVTDSGWPYFVMERVSGAPLTEYADAKRLPLPDRVRLFAQICRAVQHAHQKGIIHRDLKPSNVLVTESDGVPVCKVIDFGIAKAIEGGGAQVTRTGITIGTPAYMSPEQATSSGMDVDTRSDIYALGVMFYELVCGVLPFDPAVLGPLGVMARHAAQDPDAPSVMFASLSRAPVDGASPTGASLTSASPSRGNLAAAAAGTTLQSAIASARATDVPTLRRSLQGDLDWITLKALEKERDRRYDTATAFADDLDRHLANVPVRASPPSRSYRLRKFVRRHRAGVAFTVAVAVLLVATSVVLAVQAGRIARARAVAEQRQAQAEDLISFMVGDLRTRLASVGRFDVLDEVMKKSQAYFAAVPESQLSDRELFRRSQALRLLGDVRMEQQDLVEAMEAYRQSLQLSRRLVARDASNGEWQLGLGASHFGVGYVHFSRNDLDSALAHFAAYAGITQTLVSRAPDSLTYRVELGMAAQNVGQVKQRKGDLAGALASYREAIGADEALVRRDSTHLDWRLWLANAYNAAGVVQRQLGDLPGAERTHRLELAVKRGLVAREPENRQYQQHVALAQSMLGEVLSSEGKMDEGFREVVASRDGYARLATLDPMNPDRKRLLALAERLVGNSAMDLGDAPAALRALQSGRALLEPLAAAAPANRGLQLALARTLTSLGVALADAGRRREGEASGRRALGMLEAALAKRSNDLSLRTATAEAHLSLGDLVAGRDAAAARVHWTDALGAMAPVSDETDQLALRSTLLLKLDRQDEARPLVRELTRRGYRRGRWMTLIEQHGLS